MTPGHRLWSCTTRASEAQIVSSATPCKDRRETKQETGAILAGELLFQVQQAEPIQQPCVITHNNLKAKRIKAYINSCIIHHLKNCDFQVQRRGPTAFRRLLASLYFSGHAEALRVLTKVSRFYSFVCNWPSLNKMLFRMKIR